MELYKKLLLIVKFYSATL